MKTKISKEKLSKIYLYILIISILILDRRSFYNLVILNYKVALGTMIVISLPLLFCAIKGITINKNKKMVILVSIYMVSMIIPILIKKDYQLYYITTITYALIMFSLVLKYDLNDILKVFNKMVLVLSTYSLIAYLILSKIPLSIAQIVENSIGLKFYNYGLCFLPVSVNNRNYGIYSEPGIFQIYILLAIIITLYKDIKYKKTSLLILTLTLITTVSIAGFIGYGIILIFFIFHQIIKNKDKIKNIKKKEVLKILIIFTITLILIKGAFVLNKDSILKFKDDVVSKLKDKENMSNISRMDSLLIIGEQFLLSPLYGNKFTKVIDAPMYGNTNTITSIFAHFGIYFGIYNLFFIYFFGKTITENNFNSMGVMITLMAVLFSQYIFGTMLYAIIVMIGMKRSILKEVKNESIMAS